MGTARSGKAHHLTERIPLGPSPILDITSFSHIVSEYDSRRVFRRSGDLRLIFVARGQLDLESGGRHTTIGCSEVYVLDAGVAMSVSYAEGVELYIVRFRWTADDGSAEEALRVPTRVRLLNGGPMTHLLRMFEGYRRRRRGSKQTLRYLTLLMLCELAHGAKAPEASSSADEGLGIVASRVDAYIAAHYNRDIAAADIAAGLHYNPHYLEHLYRAERGIPIREAIHARRLLEARAQLRLPGSGGVAMIAARCGYPDPAYFRRLFKAASGMTPQEYRAKHRPWAERSTGTSRHVS